MHRVDLDRRLKTHDRREAYVRRRLLAYVTKRRRRRRRRNKDTGRIKVKEE